MTNPRAVGAALLLVGAAALFTAAPAYAGETPTPTPSPSPSQPPIEKVCDDLDTGHIDGGDETSITITAPEGFLISEYCVKAGSAQQGDGPETVVLDPPQESVTISHTSGKEISHYSVAYVVAPTTPPTTPSASTPPATTPAATTPAATTGGGGGGSTLPATGFDGTWLLFAGLGALVVGGLVVGEHVIVRRR